MKRTPFCQSPGSPIIEILWIFLFDYCHQNFNYVKHTFDRDSRLDAMNRLLIMISGLCGKKVMIQFISQS